MKKLLWLLALSLITAVCAVGFIACGEDEQIPEHTHEYQTTVVPPTCTEQGYTLHKCSCGEEYKDTYTDALGHNFVDGKCTVCKTADPNYGEPADPEHTHEYQTTVIAPTCTEQGYTLHKCNCGDEKKDTFVNALGHNFVNGKCTVCNAIDPDYIPPEPTSDEYFSFSLLSNDTYEIAAKNSNNMPANVVLPSTYNGKPVTSIGYEAFDGCYSLTSVIIPDSVTSIGRLAFYWCRRLTSITIPDSVTSIGNFAFDGCYSLTSINVSENNAKYKSIDGNLYSKDGTVLIQYAIGKTATEFTIPDSVTSIGGYAFSGCTNLTSVIIPDSVTSIGYEAFVCCFCLTSIIIPDSVTSIGDEAFYYCSSLTSITIPDSVTSIGSSAFSDCRSLTSITIPDSVTSIGEGAFRDCRSLTSVTIPDSVTSIGDSAFGWCESLTSVTIGNSVTSIEYAAFSGCNNLTSITIPDSVTSIGGWAFEYCPCIKTNKGLSYVDKWLIKADNAITSATIKNGTVGIADNAFYNCSKLTSITIPDSVTSIGNNAFSSCSRLTSIVIPDSVTSIGDWAFNGCSSLTSVTIGNSVTSIADRAFNNCTSLTSITIPDSVTSIGEWAFSHCSSLTSVTFGGTIQEWNSISKGYSWKDNVPTSCVVHCTDGNVNI